VSDVQQTTASPGAAAPATIIDFANLDAAGFEKFYAEKLEPCFAGNEHDRIAAVAAFKRRGGVAALVTVVIAIGLWLLTKRLEAPLIGGVIAGAVGYALAMQKLLLVARHVKEGYCTAIGQAMGASYTMSGFDPPALERFQQWRMIPGFDRAHYEDKFSGVYLGSGFDLYEARLEQRHANARGNTYYSQVFLGQLIRMHFPQSFAGVTVVRRDSGIFNVFGGEKGLKRVGLEDPVFEKAFEVWGADQVEARCLLHPAFMQRLLDLETRLSGSRLRCAFEQGDLIIAIEGGNLFEPGNLFRPLIDVTRAKRIVDEIGSVVRVMDEVLTAQARSG
jgi:hypothetical protein